MTCFCEQERRGSGKQGGATIVAAASRAGTPAGLLPAPAHMSVFVFWYYILRWYERRQQPRAAGVGSRRREHEALDLACRMWVLTGARSVAGERPRQKKPKIDETERRTAKNEEHLILLGVISLQ
jgi:hypothetical protein